MGWIISAIIMAVTAAASTAMSIQAANKQAKAQADAAQANLDQQVKQEQLKQQQANQQSQSDKAVRRRQALREQAKIRVASGEAGILGGASAERQDINAWQQYGFDAGIIEQNRENVMQQSVYATEAYGTQAEGIANQAKASYTGTAGALASIGLAGASGAAAGYTAGKGGSKSTSKMGVE